jgi:two-component system cell cycle sensor histidine kinase/response regulator CckA
MTRVLVVDDDQHILLFLTTALESNGYEVVNAPTALEALSILDGGTKFDLLITDLLMPMLDGDSLIRSVKERSPEVPIIVVSAQLPPSESDAPHPEGITILRKPIGYQQFVDTVKQVLGSSS